jgi:hypothetical protein
VPDNVSAEVAEFCVIPVTLVPMTAEITCVPLPELELVIVPVIFTEPVISLIIPVLVELIVTFPVPVIPPAKSDVEPVLVTDRSWLKVIAPLNVDPELPQPMVEVPLLPETTLMAFPIVVPPLAKVALALPVVSPSVIVAVPAPFALLTKAVPALIVKPPPKVFAPESVSVLAPVFEIP